MVSDPSIFVFVAAVQYFVALEIFDCDVWTCVVFKVLPIFICAALCRREPLLGVGLLLSAGGDVAMELSENNKPMFLGGVAAFLSAHVVYIVALIGMMRRSRASSETPTDRGTPMLNLAGVFAFTSLIVVMSSVLLGEGSKLPKDDTVLRGAIVLYACVIAAFGFAAFRRAVELGCFRKMGVVDGTLRYVAGFHVFTAEQASGYATFVGAVLFICSDTLLALNRFHTTIPNGKRWVMVTYYTAQMMVALSTLREK